jgi:hypothetical protein
VAGVVRHRRAGRLRGDAAELAEFAECGIPFIFDPGQAMPLYNGKELRR